MKTPMQELIEQLKEERDGFLKLPPHSNIQERTENCFGSCIVEPQSVKHCTLIRKSLELRHYLYQECNILHNFKPLTPKRNEVPS
jgi:hypothetical protein